MVSEFALERYEAHLAHLESTLDPLVEAVQEAGQARSWWESKARWTRSYGRIDPGRDPYCSFVYESHDGPHRLCLLELFDARPAEGGEQVLVLPDALLGWLRLIPFPWDPRLTTLCQVVSSLGPARILRYRPYRRCTLRVDEDAADGGRIVKVFPDAQGQAIHQGSAALWEAASRGELGFEVAEPDRWDGANYTLWQKLVRGAPVMDQLRGSDGKALVERMGRACGSIVCSSLRPTLIFDAEVQMERTTRYARFLCSCVPALTPEIDAFLADLAESYRKVKQRPLRPIHGAPHPHQWLHGEPRLGLIDFDRFAMGDPELDVATFLGEMDFERNMKVPVDDLNQAFVDGYEAVAGPLDGRLLRWYRGHKRFAKVYRTLRKVRRDGVKKATRHLQRARACLN